MKMEKKIYINFKRERDEILKNDYQRMNFQKVIDIDSEIPQFFNQILQQSICFQMEFCHFKRILVFLQGVWNQTKFIRRGLIKKNDKFAIIGRWTEIIDDNQPWLFIILDSVKENFLIYEPKINIAATTLSTFDFCERKVFLQDKYKKSLNIFLSPATKGKIKHSIFQKILPLNIQNEIEIQQIIEQEMIQNCDIFETVQLDKYEIVKQDFKNFAYKCLEFKEIYLKNKTPIEEGKNKIILKEVTEIEYPYNSYKFGFSGQIDLIFKCDLIQNQQECQEILIPFELKTGKERDNYIYQVAIYTISFFNKFQLNNVSLLYYSNTDTFKIIENNLNLIRQCFIQRNQITFILKNDIPIQFQDNYHCSMCSEQNNCIYERIKDFNFVNDIEDLIPKNSGIEKNMRKIIKNKNFQSTLIFEFSSIIFGLNQEIDWLKNKFQYFQDKNFSFENILSLSKNIQQEQQKYQYCDFQIILDKKQKDNEMRNIFDLGSSLEFKHKDLFFFNLKGKIYRVIISSIDQIKIMKIILKVKNNLLNNFLKKSMIRNDFYIQYQNNWIMFEKSSTYLKKMKSSFTSLLYQIDQNEIISFLYKPKFYEYNQPFNIRNLEDCELNLILKYKKEFNLNQSQFFALQNALKNQFYLINGFRGTGKTFVISILALIFIKLKKRLIICSLLKNTINNILEFIFQNIDNEEKQSIIVLQQKNTNPNNSLFTSFNKNKFKTFQEMQIYVQNTKVIASDVLHLNQQNLHDQKFDYFILDEASQVLEPQLVFFLPFAQNWILAGNIQQVPEIFSQKNSLKLSLFQKLYETYQNNNCDLTIQYNHNENILELYMNLKESNQMPKIHLEQENQTLELNFQNNFKFSQNLLFNQNSSVIFYDIKEINFNNKFDQKFSYNDGFLDQCSNFDKNQKFLIENQTIEFYNQYLQLGVDHKDMTIIATLKSSLHYLQSILGDDFQGYYFDKTQNLKKKIVFFLLNKDQQKQFEEQIENIKENLSHCVLSATRQLIIIGNSDYLKKYHDLNRIVEFCKKKDFIINHSLQVSGMEIKKN